MAPILRPWYDVSMAWAASSIRRSLWRLASAWIRSIRQGRPAKCTGRIAFVRGVIARSIRAGSMLNVSRSTSTKTGRAPVWMTAFAVAQKVIGVVMTSWPGPTPETTMERWSAAVHEFRAIACFAPMYSRNISSKRATRGPVPIQPDRRVATTSAISASSIAGLPKTRNSLRINSSPVGTGRRRRPRVPVADPAPPPKQGPEWLEVPAVAGREEGGQDDSGVPPRVERRVRERPSEVARIEVVLADDAQLFQTAAISAHGRWVVGQPRPHRHPEHVPAPPGAARHLKAEIAVFAAHAEVLGRGVELEALDRLRAEGHQAAHLGDRNDDVLAVGVPAPVERLPVVEERAERKDAIEDLERSRRRTIVRDHAGHADESRVTAIGHREPLEREGVEHHVVLDHRHDLATGCAHAGVPRRVGPGDGRVAHVPELEVASARAGRFDLPPDRGLALPVLALVNHDQLQREGRLLEHGPHRQRQLGRAVLGRNDHRDRHRSPARRRPFTTSGAESASTSRAGANLTSCRSLASFASERSRFT